MDSLDRTGYCHRHCDNRCLYNLSFCVQLLCGHVSIFLVIHKLTAYAVFAATLRMLARLWQQPASVETFWLGRFPYWWI